MLQKLCFVFCFFSLSCYSVFWATGEILGSQADTEQVQTEFEQWDKKEQNQKPKKVEEIQSDIKKLKKEKQRLEFKWNTFRIGNETLWDLIRDDLQESERWSLANLLVNYTALKNKTDLDIVRVSERGEDTDELRKELIVLKKRLYTTMIPYIQISKLAAFQLYIDSDISFHEKSKVVATEIEQKQEVRDERVEKIKEKIEDNSEVLREQIKIKITTKLQGKLDVFIAQDRFQSLKDESKIFLFQRLIEKTSIEKNNLQNIENPTSIIEEKIFLFNIVTEILEWYISDWR